MSPHPHAPVYQTALITGASSGIGKATAEVLAAEGYKLILLARRQDRLEALKSQLEIDCNTQCHLIACDINDHIQLKAELDALPNAFKPVDVLINNAGLALGLNPAHETDWNDWQTMIETNCLSLAFLTRQILPGLVKANHGHIINVGSIAGTYHYKGANVYGATKAFVEQFSVNLRSDLLGTAVRVTNLEPGLLNDSEFSLVRFKGDAQRADKVYEGLQPLKAADVAETVRWILQQPAHVNINRIEIMPVHQAPGGPTVAKTPLLNTN
ncbi:SDR family NAD(P)-dependent oxidoreductase [Thiomicrorhabdus sp. zzn3]|uniref:SDR family NAD(P)-dependent oxidoreductase n=1 Tax=Thiomicrorhabdus sp. zzn3 TaxID=3039775 RepID=UPI002436E4F6|nr:SDR family NAD(P)-dependent oxidoreductase [Thiomicrorhabdus sp. zzn3]MDG6777742.1 SDR family NAD(P)-dependent oxidoreductase [Thiomicrorhabdus sp. zzn3]